jgi:hypothetical protein
MTEISNQTKAELLDTVWCFFDFLSLLDNVPNDVFF